MNKRIILSLFVTCFSMVSASDNDRCCMQFEVIKHDNNKDVLITRYADGTFFPTPIEKGRVRVIPSDCTTQLIAALEVYCKTKSTIETPIIIDNLVDVQQEENSAWCSNCTTVIFKN